MLPHENGDQGRNHTDDYADAVGDQYHGYLLLALPDVDLAREGTGIRVLVAVVELLLLAHAGEDLKAVEDGGGEGEGLEHQGDDCGQLLVLLLALLGDLAGEYQHRHDDQENEHSPQDTVPDSRLGHAYIRTRRR